MSKTLALAFDPHELAGKTDEQIIGMIAVRATAILLSEIHMIETALAVKGIKV